MKRKDIDKALRKAGWVIIHGGNHDLAQHPQKPGIKIPIPRHTEVNEQTARGILKQAGIQCSPPSRSLADQKGGR